MADYTIRFDEKHLKDLVRRFRQQSRVRRWLWLVNACLVAGAGYVAFMTYKDDILPTLVVGFRNRGRLRA
jgi:hypothetical protein